MRQCFASADVNMVKCQVSVIHLSHFKRRLKNSKVFLTAARRDKNVLDHDEAFSTSFVMPDSRSHPAQCYSDVSRHAAGKVDDLKSEPVAARLEVFLPKFK